MTTQEEQERITQNVYYLVSKGLSNEDIIQKLSLDDATFFRYKKKVVKQIIKAFKPNPNEIEYNKAMLVKALEDCYSINKQIAEDPNVQPHERTAASEMFVVARAQLRKLSEQGYVKPQLPVKNYVHMGERVVQIPHDNPEPTLNSLVEKYKEDGKREERKDQ